MLKMMFIHAHNINSSNNNNNNINSSNNITLIISRTILIMYLTEEHTKAGHDVKYNENFALIITCLLTL